MMKSRRRRGTVAVVVIVCFLTAGCAESMMQSPGKAALLCGAGGAGAGAAIGAAVGRNWQSALIGAAVGALAAGVSCFAFAEYKSQQVRDYRQTEQATGYQPSQGDSIQIIHYGITPAAARPGSSVAFNATYTVMTPNPEADVTVIEVRSLSVYDSQTNTWRELGRVPNQVTVKPGTRQADGKFDVRSGVAQGNYQIVFQVVKDNVNDTKNLPLIVTTNEAILASPQARVAEVSAPGAKPVDAVARPAMPAVTSPAVGPTPAAVQSGAPLSSLGEQTPGAATQVATARSAAPTATRVAYFVASKVDGKGTLRAGPGANHTIVGVIGQGERYPIVERTGAGEQTWYKIRLDSGAEVWVAGLLGQIVEE